MVSPPPARENPIEFAMACASVSVPLEKLVQIQKRPIGPFHKMVFDCFRFCVMPFIVSGPKSKNHIGWL